MTKVLVTPRSFAKFNNKEVIAKFESHGIEMIPNPYGRILTESELITAMADVDAIIVGVDPITSSVMGAAPHLKTIAKYGVGTDNIDLEKAKELGISVTKTINANSEAVADYTFALMLDVARNVTRINNNAKDGDWKKITSIDVYGKKIGIIGLGAIGKGMVSRSQGFNMEVYGFDLFKDEDYIEANNIHFTSIEEIIKECDFISLHLPLTEDTKNILNKESLKDAKDNLVIVNTARGGLINEDDIYEMLKENKIYGLGIDAFAQEPPIGNPLLDLDNVIVGSHTAAGSIGATNSMTNMAVDNVINELEKK